MTTTLSNETGSAPWCAVYNTFWFLSGAELAKPVQVPAPTDEAVTVKKAPAVEEKVHLRVSLNCLFALNSAFCSFCKIWSVLETAP